MRLCASSLHIAGAHCVDTRGVPFISFVRGGPSVSQAAACAMQTDVLLPETQRSCANYSRLVPPLVMCCRLVAVPLRLKTLTGVTPQKVQRRGLPVLRGKLVALLLRRKTLPTTTSQEMERSDCPVLRGGGRARRSWRRASDWRMETAGGFGSVSRSWPAEETLWLTAVSAPRPCSKS